MWLTVVSVNWGRGYEPGEFKANVARVLDFTDGREHVALMVQELDEEPDPAHEKKRFREMLEPGSHRVGWQTREPIVVSPGFNRIRRERVKVTMEAGGKIGAPAGTGPTRYAVTCIADDGEVAVGLGNTHPHRFIQNAKVIHARQRGIVVFRSTLAGVQRKKVPVIWGGDMNDHHLGEVLPGEETAIHKGNDYIRYRQHPQSMTRLELVNTGSLNGTIDPHDPIWARFRVTTR